MPDLRIINADVMDGLTQIEGESIQTVVTSPPYWGLRDYGVEGQIGLERTPEEYVERLVAVFREVRRVLRANGTLWLNLGDSYAHQKSGDTYSGFNDRYFGRDTDGGKQAKTVSSANVGCLDFSGLKPKDLVGIPWRVALALQADGWWLRSDIIWAKPNPMPESVTDRPTKAHEYIFLLAKSERYFFGADAVREVPVVKNNTGTPGHMRRHLEHAAVRDWIKAPSGGCNTNPAGRNVRTVWAIPSEPYPEAHFATFPTALPERCILAGSRPGDTVLDPFAGSGTTLMVARGLGRHAIGIELNPDYCKLIEKRCSLPWERSKPDDEQQIPLF